MKSARPAAPVTKTSAPNCASSVRVRKPRSGGVFALCTDFDRQASRATDDSVGDAHVALSGAGPRPHRHKAMPSAANTWPRPAGASAVIPKQRKCRTLRRRPRAQDAVRNVLRAEHHAAPEAGIGRWTEAEFVNAIRHGRRPDGANYFPAFPYTSFTESRPRPARPLGLPAHAAAGDRPNQPHDLRSPRLALRRHVLEVDVLHARPVPGIRGQHRPSIAAPISCRPSGIAASATRRATSWAASRRAGTSPEEKHPRTKTSRI